MLSKLAVSAAVATALTSIAYAQNPAPVTPAPQASGQVTTNGQPAQVANYYKQNVYDDSGNKIGEISDVIMGRDNKIEGFVIAVGGFLGAGEKDVAVPFNAVKTTQNNGNVRLTMNTTKDQLERAPAFKFENNFAQVTTPQTPVERNPFDRNTAQQTPADRTAAERAQADRNAADRNASDRNAATNAADRNLAERTPARTTTGLATTGAAQALASIPPNTITISSYYKKNVYDRNDAKIGEISDVLVNNDGKIDGFIVSVGGFLGIGEKNVAVPFDAVKATQRNGSWWLTMDSTKDQLEKAPGYKYDNGKAVWVPV
jgi:sporulation protein YlmC with PRC-barrel domain